MKVGTKTLIAGFVTVFIGIFHSEAATFDEVAEKFTKEICTNDTTPSRQGEIRELDEKQKKWIYKHIKYPKQAVEEGIQGNVVVEYVVDADGTVSDVKVVRSAHPLLDKEAVRVIGSMPKFKPILEDGTPARKTYRTLVPFKLCY